ncbi:MAG: hypothetical protein QW520_03140 [Methanomassiliicoccales archaeon]
MANKGCVIEIGCIDPETYSNIVNHPLRKEILKALYRKGLEGPVTKQSLAEAMKLNYHQLVYQLNNHLREFWEVAREEKVRGTRMEYIVPSHPHAVYISLGKEHSIYIFDPLANLFGPMSLVGTRCDFCTPNEAARCSKFVESSCGCSSELSESESALLKANGRSNPFRPLDKAIICALRKLSSGEKCVVNIPCEGCAFLKKTISIQIL